MNICKTIVILGACAVVSACGGSSGSGVLSTSGPILIADLNGAGRAYFDLAADGFTPLDQTALEAQGSASYAGYMLAVPNGTLDALVGRALIDATFTDGGTLTGDVTDLILIPENEDVVAILQSDPADGYTPISGGTDVTRLSGALDLSGGAVRNTGSAATVSVDVAGSVDIPGAAFDTRLIGTETFDVTGRLQSQVAQSGEFVGQGSLYARGPRVQFNLGTVVFAE